MPHRYSSSDDTHAMVARIAPAIFKLLSDGLPRTRHEMVEALAPQHAKDEVKRTIMRGRRRRRVAACAVDGREAGCHPDQRQLLSEPGRTSRGLPLGGEWVRGGGSAQSGRKSAKE